MLGYFASLFGFGSGGDDGSRRVESASPARSPDLRFIDAHLRARIERGECLSREDVETFRREMDLRNRREHIDYRLERCRR